MPEIDLLTAGRHLASLRARAGFGLGALAFASIELAHLHAGQAARLKAQQLAAIRQGRVPTGGKEAALPAVDRALARRRVGGNIGWHSDLFANKSGAARMPQPAARPAAAVQQEASSTPWPCRLPMGP